MSAYGWLFDPKRCIECSACEAACKQWNQVETGVNVRYRRVRSYEEGTFPNVRVTAISMSCNHCETPTCARACPAKAIRKRADGIVLLDTNQCVGCGQCFKFCPYGAPQMNFLTRRSYKCTMCADRIDQNLQPACATVCPTGALRWGPWEEISSHGTDRMAHFANPALTRPRIRFESRGW
jgi:anaerobic dimethyl sulfoxide reductase subunit B (iron-sulfur subunit)